MGLHPLQDYKERRCQDQPKNMRNWYIFYRILRGACILFEFANDLILQITRQGSQNLLEVLLLCKYTADATQIKIDRQWGSSFWIDSGTHNTHPLSQKYVESTAMACFVGVAGVVAILFIIDAPVIVVDFLNPFNDDSRNVSMPASNKNGGSLAPNTNTILLRLLLLQLTRLLMKSPWYCKSMESFASEGMKTIMDVYVLHHCVD
jgi:hypothetical protein